MNKTILYWLSSLGVPVVEHEWFYWVISIAAILLVVYFCDLIFRRLVIPTIRKVTYKTNFQWDEIILNDSMFKDISRLVPPVLLAVLLPIVFIDSEFFDFIMRVNYIYLVVVVCKLICTFLASLYDLSLHHERLKNHSLQSVYQMLKVLVICVALIIVVSILINKNPGYILTALGASAAVLMLVFKDMIVGLVAGVQLSVNDMLRPGDWISMPKYGADGDVVEVSLTTVKVQNWDKTITTIPPYALVSDSFQNWRGMFSSGGRRIKRSIFIDTNSITFCEGELRDKLIKKGVINADDNKQYVNLTLFREWLENWLHNHPAINKEMILLVRQLQPTVQGLPLELYFFFDGTMWVPYEHLQAEIFEYIFALLPEFGLRTFQSPTGSDINGFLGGASK